jgi:hypothetical protein
VSEWMNYYYYYYPVWWEKVCPIWNMLFKHSCAQDPRADDGSVVEPLSGTLGDLRTGVWASNLLVCRLKALPEPSATLSLTCVGADCLSVGFVACAFPKQKTKNTQLCVYVCVCVCVCVLGSLAKLSCWLYGLSMAWCTQWMLHW